MISEWVERSLGELIALQRGHDLPAEKRKPGPIPVMGSAGITGHHDKATTQGPGVVIGRSGVGSMGVVSYIDRDYWALNTSLYVTDFRGNDVKFIYYLLSTINFRQFDTGSAQASLNRNLVYPHRVRVPPSAVEQEEIARTLGAIDDRIALLRATNATVEAIAQALFKSWFIDFDPVFAKQEGHSPKGMDEATAALFPNGFEESRLGLVPKGWRVGVLGDVAETVRCQLQPDEMDRELDYVGLEHIPRKCLSLYEWGAAEGLESAKFRFREGDVLFGKLRPYFHKVVVAPTSGVCSTDILVCRPLTQSLYGFIVFQLFSSTLISYADRLSNGAKMPRVNWKDLAAYELVIPPANIASSFTKTIQPMLSLMKENAFRMRTLVDLRDTLLPRLISGQLRLSGAEAFAA